MSCLLMGLRHPPAAPWGLDKAGIVPWLPFVSLPVQAWPAACPWLAGAWGSARGAPGLLTHQVGSAGHALGKEAHLGRDTCSGGPEVKRLLQTPPLLKWLQHTALQRPQPYR